MRDVMIGYYRPNEDEFKALWNEGIFVFDTSALLNLYSYPEKERNVFFTVLERIATRLWVPYQVAMEFERNRIARIKLARQPIEGIAKELRGTVKKVQELKLEMRDIEEDVKDLPARLRAFEKANERICEAIDKAVGKLPKVSLDDPIRDRLGKILESCIGKPPKDQAALDDLVRDAQARFDSNIPPGFLDKGKSRHADRGIVYQGDHGDLILWRQLLCYATEQQLKKVVLVTGDRKEDWWSREVGLTLGPSPQLIQEMSLVAGVELFWMYLPESFLEQAGKYMKATGVTHDVVERVKEASATAQPVLVYADFTMPVEWTATPSMDDLGRTPIREWIAQQHPDCKVEQSDVYNFPTFIVRCGEGLPPNISDFWYHVAHIVDGSVSTNTLQRIETFMSQAVNELRAGRLSRFTLIIAVPQGAPRLSDATLEQLRTLAGHYQYREMTVLVGYILAKRFWFYPL